MKSLKEVVFFIAVVLLFSSCKKNNNINTIDLQEFRKAVNSMVNLEDSIQKKFYLQIYDSVNPTPYWYNSPKNFKEKLMTLRDFENKSMYEHGISNTRFYADSINKLIVSIDTSSMDYNKLAKLDMLMSKSYFDYCVAMRYGCFDPREIYPRDYFIKVERPDSAFIQTSFQNTSSAEKVENYLTSLQPKDKLYKKLQDELKYLYKFKDSVFTRIPMFNSGSILNKGEKNYAVSLLARRMMITGRLPFNSRYDTIRTLSDTILRALNRYRDRYNLEKMEALDNATIKTLNKDFGTLYWTVAANMERMRWKPTKAISHKHVWVNTATARLRMMRGDTLEGALDVGVGRAGEHETPLLIGKMYEIVLNPTWTIPNSIIINEISKKGAAAASYITRNNMKVYRNGQLQNPYEINWGAVNSKFQPYIIVQDPGETNSLGRIKFNFDNPFSIYLHDTNAKYVFNSHQRDVSHGCVRVKNPLQLVFFCLSDVDSSNPEALKNRKFLEDRIRYTIGMQPVSQINANLLTEMGEKAKLKSLRLNPGVTIIIDYRTCFVNENGKIFFTEDYYKMDNILMAKLSNID